MDTVADTGPATGWPRFPRALLGTLQEGAPEGARLQLALWHGETVTVLRVVRETEDGLLAEVERPGAREDDGPVVAAIPWHAIARAQRLPRPARRSRPGFLAGD